MSPNATSLRSDKQSLHYIVRSGMAGGIAGCVVCFSARLPPFYEAYVQLARQRRLLHLLTESRYSFKHPILISKNMQVRIISTLTDRLMYFPQGHGVVHSALERRYTDEVVSWDCFKAIPLHYIAFFLTQP